MSLSTQLVDPDKALHIRVYAVSNFALKYRNLFKNIKTKLKKKLSPLELEMDLFSLQGLDFNWLRKNGSGTMLMIALLNVDCAKGNQ